MQTSTMTSDSRNQKERHILGKIQCEMKYIRSQSTKSFIIKSNRPPCNAHLGCSNGPSVMNQK